MLPMQEAFLNNSFLDREQIEEFSILIFKSILKDKYQTSVVYLIKIAIFIDCETKEGLFLQWELASKFRS